MNDSSTKAKTASNTHPGVQTQFVEECVREGWRIADVQLWQNLCKKLATLSADSELAMMVLLGIADEHGISPIQLCAYARDEGYKQLEMDAIEHLVSMYGERDDEDDDAKERRIPEATQDDVASECDEPKNSDQDDDDGVPTGKTSSTSKRAKKPIAFPNDGDDF